MKAYESPNILVVPVMPTVLASLSFSNTDQLEDFLKGQEGYQSGIIYDDEEFDEFD